MTDKGNDGSFWLEEITGQIETPMRKKRKYRTKKKEYNGWGSTSLIWFLQSIGLDTSNHMTQTEVTEIINEYVKRNNLVHPSKKKRVVCDERLHSLFGRKTIGRMKIHDLLESHFAENCGESSDDILFNSDDDDESYIVTSERKSQPKSQPKKQIWEKPKSCFASIIPFNIKLVYLKRSLVEELVKDPDTFETKVVGSFIRIRCDPNDYLQKNSHQLLQVKGITKGSGINEDILLQVSGFIKDISIPMISDDNFTEEECEDLHRRVKDGMLKRPLVVEIEQTARVLHEDITKHWLSTELVQLQNLIDRANEKGWRRELDEYLQKREKLQKPAEQERLLHELPQVIAEDLETESKTLDFEADKNVENSLQEKQASLVTDVPKAVANGSGSKATKLDIANPVIQEIKSPKSIISPRASSKVPFSNVAVNDTMSNHTIQLKSPKSILSPRASSEVPLLNVAVNDTMSNHTFNVKSPKSILSPRASSEVPLFNVAVNDTMSNRTSHVKPPKSILSPRASSEVPPLNVAVNHTMLNRTSHVKSPKSVPSPRASSEAPLLNVAVNDTVSNRTSNVNSPMSILSPRASSEVPLLNVAMNDTMLNRTSHVKSPKSILSPRASSEVPLSNVAGNDTMFNRTSHGTIAGLQWSAMPVQKQPEQLIDFTYKNDGLSKPAESNEARISQGSVIKPAQPLQPQDKPVQPSQPQVIELSDDDDEDEQPSTAVHVSPAEQVQSCLWYYKDPQGIVQGPFTLISLKRWSDAGYFTPSFKVWKLGQREDEAALLVNVLHQFFPVC